MTKALRTSDGSAAFTTPDFTLASGLALHDAEGRLLRFCQKEYAYYDGVQDLEPNRILPIDVMVTIAMNSYVSQADQVRTIHQGLARVCDARLAAIPVNADLAMFDPDGAIFGDLLSAAVQVPRVLAAVATKVLHRKRRNYIPMLDGEILKHYLRATKRADWIDTKAQDKRTAGFVATEVWKSFRTDLVTNHADIQALQARLEAEGFPLTPVRILEILVWLSTEPRGYYRS